MRNSFKRNRMSLRETAFRFLFEQGEEDAPEEDTAEEAGADEGGGEEDTAADEGEAGGDTDAAEPGGEEGADEKEEEKVDLADKFELSDSIDNELDALLVDYEEEARKSAVVNKQQKKAQNESSLRFLLEDVSSDVDLRHFAASVARLIKNYQNLIDWKTVILNKVESFITSNYGEDTAKSVLELLELDHGLVKQTANKEPEDLSAPIAVGAREAGGG